MVSYFDLAGATAQSKLFYSYAEEYYGHALKIAKTLAMTEAQDKLRYCIGKSQFYQRKLDDAIKTFKKTLLMDQDPNILLKSQIKEMIAQSYLFQGKYEEAINELKEDVKMLQNAPGNRFAEEQKADSICLLAKAYANTKKWDVALSMFKAASKKYGSVYENRKKLETDIWIARIIKNTQVEESKRVFEESLADSKIDEYPDLKALAGIEVSKIFNSQGLHDEAGIKLTCAVEAVCEGYDSRNP